MGIYYTINMDVLLPYGQSAFFKFNGVDFNPKDFKENFKFKRKKDAVAKAKKQSAIIMPLHPQWRMENEWFPYAPIQGIRITVDRTTRNVKNGLTAHKIVKEISGYNPFNGLYFFRKGVR
jgi:hypothetical protein